MHHKFVFALLALPALLSAQATAPATVSPGMTKAQVIAALGNPATSRTTNEHTYLFYQNACGKECGMNDLVILQGDSVVDAIFRSPSRHYTGTSSSPNEATPATAASRRRAAKPLAVPPAGKTATATAKPATVPARPASPDTAAHAAKPAPVVAAPVVAAPTPAAPKAAVKREVTVPGTKREITVPGTKREVTVPGTRSDSIIPVRTSPPGAANDTRPSIPVEPKTAPPLPATPAPEQKPAT